MPGQHGKTRKHYKFNLVSKALRSSLPQDPELTESILEQYRKIEKQKTEGREIIKAKIEGGVRGEREG